MQPNKNLHPVHKCDDGLFNAFTGTKINIKHPTVHMIKIDDIAHALSQICRFGGHTKRLYTVAQHSVLVAELAPPHLKRYALLHDATEAYLGDVIKPLKVILGEDYKQLEIRFHDVICDKFKLDPLQEFEVKQYDKDALELEFKYHFQNDKMPLEIIACNAELDFDVNDPELAEFCFMKAYAELFT